MATIDYSKHYLRWHNDSESHQGEMNSFYANLLKPYLPQDKNAQILDIGCGMGLALKALKTLGYSNISGIEIDENQTKAAKSKGLEVELVSDSAAFLTGGLKRYDLILAIDVLEHIPLENQLTFSRAVREALSEKGAFLATVPNANSAIAGRWRYIDWTHQISFTEASLNFLLVSAGFSKIEIGGAEIKQFFAPQNVKIKRAASKIIKTFTRYLRRIELLGELGIDEGMSIPIEVNLLSFAKK